MENCMASSLLFLSVRPMNFSQNGLYLSWAEVWSTIGAHCRLTHSWRLLNFLLQGYDMWYV